MSPIRIVNDETHPSVKMTTLERFKLSSITWDGDKDPGGFQAFEDTMGAFVSCPIGGIDHSWKSDIFDIAERDIKLLSEQGTIVRLDMACPCEDHSPSRMLPSKFGKKLANPRQPSRYLY